MIESGNVVDNLLDSLFYKHICSDLKVFFSQGVSSTLDSDFEDWLRLIEFYREKTHWERYKKFQRGFGGFLDRVYC